MSMELTARSVEAAEMAELESLVLSIAENQDGSGWKLIFMRPSRPTDQDLALNQATYAITSHEGVTVYGGVVDWSRSGATFRFVMTAEAASVLGLDEQFVLITVDDAAAGLIDDARQWIVG